MSHTWHSGSSTPASMDCAATTFGCCHRKTDNWSWPHSSNTFDLHLQPRFMTSHLFAPTRGAAFLALAMGCAHPVGVGQPTPSAATTPSAGPPAAGGQDTAKARPGPGAVSAPLA